MSRRFGTNEEEGIALIKEVADDLYDTDEEELANKLYKGIELLQIKGSKNE